ncbi:MAG: NAD+ synthase [Acidimicrobiales bacterium]|nr:NAD+ synthase [Acidimicrobiales bacterium]
MAHVRVAACQINTVVGDLEGNATRILDAAAGAARAGADLAIFPELAVTGYPPEDLLERPAFVADNRVVFERLAQATGECAVAFGYVGVDASGRLTNSAALCARGQVVADYAKRMLPNYGVFDERRWFAPGEAPAMPVVVAGVPIGLTICEDMWFADGPMQEEARAGARLLVNLNASPYSRGRRLERLTVLRERAAETGCAIAYVNQVGGQDELVFDGASMVVGADGELLAEAPQFAEAMLLYDLEVADGRAESVVAEAGAVDSPSLPIAVVSHASRSGETGVRVGRGATAGSAGSAGSEGASGSADPGGLAVVRGRAEPLSECAEVYEALVLGTRDYVGKNGFTDVVVGLSGGIDSSLVVTVAVDALGPEHVHGVAMPSRYSSEGSIDDARLLGDNLGIDLAAVPIEPVHGAFASSLAPLLGADPAGLTDENLQSRIRGVLLMALSNARGWLVLTTGNKSEMATGYSTLYGDSAGGFAVIKDVPKTLVYELCRYRNARAGRPLIPDAVLVKAPSAELRPEQRDEDSLPPYSELDPIVAGYVEGDRSAADLVAEGFHPATVARVVALVDRAEYKRRQMPPGVRISGKAFGKDRRMPITNHYEGLSEGAGAPDGRSEAATADSHRPGLSADEGAIGVKGVSSLRAAEGEASAVV